jgi:hypothetical protein
MDDTIDSDCVNGVVCLNLPADDTEDLTIDCGFVEPEEDIEGCTPGYWKLIEDDPATAHHECNWTGVGPYDLFSATCADTGTNDTVCFADAFPGKSLIDVLEKNTRPAGPHLRQLGFHAVAAYLNAASPDVNYGIATPAEVIIRFNMAYASGDYRSAKNEFADFNENEGCCPLGNCLQGGLDDGISDCCEPHGGMGCDEDECEDVVCQADPECCDVSWDDDCAALGSSLCCAYLCENNPDRAVSGDGPTRVVRESLMYTSE